MSNDEKLSLAQAEAVEYMLRPESDHAALLAFDMGLGKTRTGLMFARALGQRCTLIVVPLQTVKDWMLNAEEQMPGVTIHQITSKTDGQDALTRFRWREAGIYIIGQEYWERLAWKKIAVPKRRPNETQKYRKVDSKCWAGDGYLLIYDESHRSANHESWTHRALMNIDPRVFKLSMSGTFMGDRFDGAFGATRWLWPHRVDIIPPNIFAWRDMWAETEYDHFAPRNQKTVGEKVEGAFVSALPCYIRMESELPKPIPVDVWVDIYPEQRRVYDELDDLMVAWINNEPLTAEYSITKRARQRQATLAYPTLTFDEAGELLEVSFDDDAASAKADALIADIEGHGPLAKLGFPTLLVGQQLLIGTDSQKFARLLTNRLNERFGDVAREWSGKTAWLPGKQKRTKDRPDRVTNKQLFIDGKIRILVCVQAAMGTGTDGLQAASHIAISMSLADRRINNEQFVKRLNRMGQQEVVYDIHYLAKETLDSGQISKQMEAALRMQRMLRRKHKEEERARRRAEALAASSI